MHKPGMLSEQLVACSLLLCTSMTAVYNWQEAVVRKRHMGFMAAFSTAKLLSSYIFFFFLAPRISESCSNRWCQVSMLYLKKHCDVKFAAAIFNGMLLTLGSWGSCFLFSFTQGQAESGMSLASSWPATKS